MLYSVFVIGSFALFSPVALASLEGIGHSTDCLTPGGSISSVEFLHLLTCHRTLLSCVA